MAACKIQQGECRQVCTVSHVFAAIARYIHYTSRACGSFYSLFRCFLPSRATTSITSSSRASFLSTVHLIPSISHYPTNSLPTRVSQKSSWTFSLFFFFFFFFGETRRDRYLPFSIAPLEILFEPSGPISCLLSSSFSFPVQLR